MRQKYKKYCSEYNFTKKKVEISTFFCIFATGLLAGRDACNPPLDSGCVPMRGIDVPKPTCTVLRKERHLMVSFFNCENAHTHYLI